MYFFLLRLAELFRPKYHLRDEIEELNELEIAELRGQCLSLSSYAFEKSLRNRIRNRRSDAIYWVKKGEVMQAAVFVSQIEEIEDIIREIHNLRQDVTKNSNANERKSS